ncbi:isocitrate/isopropylmalate dehydrogenase family protein [Candidimonas humi]|uniref:Isocitrate/isopropylmalate dehydrogenase family protein n=1 Tax=Candidimonas humi TaxID=683355 RepID=A0ABV8P3S7_9BURK|nr:isocitrate/isopropylmalate family dehydrogenase [Candidimonas humi]MBV6307328.1 isocitrate/isopropylmalate dehydrogenase family protein [Candidimonas humi]
MKIIVLPGDGIGAEITGATVGVLEAASSCYGLDLQLEREAAGHESLRLHGATVTDALLDKVKAADGLVLGPMATYDFKDESKGEINPSKFFRKELDLYANIRPARTYKGMPARLGEFDLVVVRENTEGFYADRNIESGSSEMLITPDVAISLRRITRQCCERIARSAFELAMMRKRHVTIVHKANVLKIADGMFIDICHEVGKEFPEVSIDEIIVDAMMAHVVRAPQRFDVIVTTNMFGDILSDLTAELSGSLGLGGSLNAGSRYAMAQAAHGSAPDIAGQDIANPFSLVLSAAMLLGWHGQRVGDSRFLEAGKAISEGVAQAIEAGEATRDVCGRLGTRATGLELARRVAGV